MLCATAMRPLAPMALIGDTVRYSSLLYCRFAGLRMMRCTGAEYHKYKRNFQDASVPQGETIYNDAKWLPVMHSILSNKRREGTFYVYGSAHR